MPVTKQHTGRVVAAPARCKRYNIPDSELKGFGLRVEPPRQDGAGTKSCLLPTFGEMPIADISAADVQAWFAGLRDRPGAANRFAPILSVILERAHPLTTLRKRLTE
jgi:hypothetical protein